MEGERGVMYGQCQRNYGARQGIRITDGCEEFTLDAFGSQYCAACGCHRNFHSRIILIDDEAPIGGNNIDNGNVNNDAHNGTARNSQNIGHVGDGYPRARDNCRNEITLPIEVQDHDLKLCAFVRAMNERGLESNASGKRLKTKFTPEQIAMMRDFAESLGWKMTDRDREPEVTRFCNAIGISKHTFRVWLNNNKNTYGPGSTSAPHGSFPRTS